MGFTRDSISRNLRALAGGSLHLLAALWVTGPGIKAFAPSFLGALSKATHSLRLLET